MSNKVFVGGLSWSTTDEGLRQAFEQFGAIDEAKVITDRETGRSRGFGFITFTDSEHAMKSITEMDGTELDGRIIRVNEAEERRPRDNGNYGGAFGGNRGKKGGGRKKRGGGGGGGRYRW